MFPCTLDGKLTYDKTSKDMCALSLQGRSCLGKTILEQLLDSKSKSRKYGPELDDRG
jgi:hypothetical protein